MLRHRLTIGPLLIALLIAAFWLDEYLAPSAAGAKVLAPRGVVLMIAGVALCAIATLELKLIFRACGIRTYRGILLASSIAGLLVPWLVVSTADPLTAVAVTASAATLVLTGSLLWHAVKRRPSSLPAVSASSPNEMTPQAVYGAEVKGATAAAGAALLTFVYLGLMFGFVLALRREHSAWVVLGVLLITKSCDIGAFFTGTLIGRHKLIPWLSKGKTWEGLFGGIMTAAGMGLFGAWILRESGLDGVPTNLWPWRGALYGGLFALVGQAGDLMASMFKRDAGIKDSGAIVPGFGGVLDVLDSILLVGPLAYWLLHIS